MLMMVEFICDEMDDEAWEILDELDDECEERLRKIKATNKIMTGRIRREKRGRKTKTSLVEAVRVLRANRVGRTRLKKARTHIEWIRAVDDGLSFEEAKEDAGVKAGVDLELIDKMLVSATGLDLPWRIECPTTS